MKHQSPGRPTRAAGQRGPFENCPSDKRNLPDPNEDRFASHIDFRETNRPKNLGNGLHVAARAKFRLRLDRVQPDIVHLQNLHAHLTPSILFEPKGHGSLVVWTMHDYKLICPKSTFINDRTGQILVMAGATDAAAHRIWLSQLPPNAQYAGLQSGVDLARLLCGAQAVVVPSIWYENQPFCASEAFAQHKTVIASDLGGPPEFVAHQERGLLVLPGDPRALADAMAWLAAHPAQARAMGEQAFYYVAASTAQPAL